jgi:hypothetical protein
MMKLVQRFSFFICAIAGMFMFPNLVGAQATKGFGIDRSNLTRENEAVQEKTLRDIHALHATWFRDVLSGTNPEGIAKLVNEVRLAKQSNLNFLANVLAIIGRLR